MTSTLTRRGLTLGLAALPLPALAQRAAPALSAADQALVNRAATYLQGLTEAKARFVQTDARGAQSTGSLYLRRPGKARFAYDPPSGLLVVSDGGNVSIQDQRLKTFDRYPLAMTPLSLFLAKQIRFDKSVQITRVTRFADGFAITARDARRQAEGQITLNFTDTPLALAGWTITDAQGGATRVRLTGLTRVSGLANTLFVLNDPRPKNVGRGKM